MSIFAGLVPVSIAEGTGSFELTEDESVYLEQLRKRTVTIAYSYDLINAEFDGVQQGLMEPILQILRNEFGLTVEMVKTNWHDAFENIKSGEADFYGPIAISEIRRQEYITVEPFYRSYSKIMTRFEDPVHSMLGLYNRPVGLLEGSVISPTMQAYLGPRGQTIYFASMDDMITGLADGTIDAFATVDNAEFEIMRYGGIQFEFSIDNFYVDQGLISGNEEMRTLADILNRYLNENPQVSDEIAKTRRNTLMRHSKEMLKDEIESLRSEHEEITIYSDLAFYPLCYDENGVIKGMQTELNDIFTELTGIPIRFGTEEEYSGGMATAAEKLRTGECMAYVGAYYNNSDVWTDPNIEYSPLLWMETIRTYSYDQEINLSGKKIGVIRYATNYLGWKNTTGNPPVLYNSGKDMLDALKKGEIDAAFMGEMRFNYAYSVRKEYSLREVSGMSAQAPMHMLYSAQNKTFNALYNEAMVLFQILNPTSLGQWRTLSDRYKYDYISIRQRQQVLTTIVIIVFVIMLIALVYLFIRNLKAYKTAKRQLVDALDKVHYDALTGIYNRRYFEESMKRAIKACSRSGSMLSVMMIDVDHFKKFNDTYGHSEGDACLRAVAAAIKDSMTREEDFVARYGGEEFVVVLPFTDESGARHMVSKIFENIKACAIRHESSDAAPIVTVSIGVTTGKAAYVHNSEKYVVRADEALYMSKQNGRNRYTFLELK